MIPNNTKDMTVVSNISASKTGQFTVDQASLGKIMSVLTNLYTDPEMAVVREYLTNALDAQVEAQKSNPDYVWRPIEVTLPSHFSKEYKVRDFGIGMSVDDLENIYSKYGKSTKESSNDVTGMLGLGSKCALTYTGQFTITGYKDGVRARAIISKDDNDIPVFMVVDTRATDEPNGVEISVPVRDRNSFHEKTASFLRWWKDGQVLVNGQEPEKHGLTEAKPGIFIVDGDRYGQARSYVIMGNVPYAVDEGYVPDTLRSLGVGFAAYVPMASVDFPPSREELFYNNRTKKVLSDIADGLAEKILSRRREDFENASSPVEAHRIFESFPRSVRNHPRMSNLTYKGEQRAERITFGRDSNGDWKRARRLRWGYNEQAIINEVSTIHVPRLMSYKGKGLIVTGVNIDDTITPTTKKKILHYVKENNLFGTKVILIESDISSVWLSEMTRVTIDDIKAIKLQRTASKSATVPTYDIFDYDPATKRVDYRTESGLITSKRTVAYVSPHDIRESPINRGTDENELATALGADYSLVVLAKNRFEKFLRLNPKAKTVAEAFQEVINKKVANSTPIGALVGNLSRHQVDFCEKVNVKEIDDPDLVSVVSAQQSGGVGDGYAEAESLVRYAARASVRALTVPQPTGATMENPFDKYYLINQFGGARPISHMVIYANAVYAMSNKK